MADGSPTEPITVRTRKQTVQELDALAAVMDRSRNYLVNQAIDQFLEVNAWQMERIRQGMADADAGRVRPAEDVFAEIGKKHGWSL